GGAVSAALVPVLSDYCDLDDDDLGRIVGTLLIGAAALLAILVAILVLLAQPLAVLLGVSDPRVQPLTIQLIQTVVPALFFLGIAGVVGAVCYARRRFVYPAFSTALFNVGIISCAVLLHGRLGVASLAVGVVVGAALQVATLLPGLRGVRVRLVFAPRHPAVRRMIGLYGPVAAGLVISEIGVLLDRNLANQTGLDSVALMRFATTVVQLPLGLVATVTSLAALPVLARLADEPEEFLRTLSGGLRLALLAIAPLAVFLVVFAEPVIRLVFQRGAFDAHATAATVGAFLLYAPQLPFVAIDQLLIYAFYARKNTVIPMLVGLGGVCVYLGSALTLIGPLRLGVSGLIIANTLQNSLHAVVLWVLLNRMVGSLAAHGLPGTLGRALLASAAAAALGLAFARLVAAPPTLLPLLAYVGVAGTLILGVYGVGLLVLGVEEVIAVPRVVRTRLRSRFA
ncbi:MAG TPA: lipid II flippase MurJ, partial [Chloroflexota bacterium]|nr:lipid II flippase MurJ [Chloroflexota bacterium]